MASSDDKKQIFPDYTAEQGQHGDPHNQTVLRRRDKTRIKKTAPAAETVSEAGDQTVFRGKQNAAVASLDNTPSAPVDATQIRSPAAPAKPAAGGNAVPPESVQAAAPKAPDTAAQATGQHRVLKNRFLLEKVLGVGGMGVVYKAKDRLKVEAHDRDPYVAIKVLSDEFKSHPDAFISLQRESRKAQRLSQPNIVKVYDFDRDGDVVFMTMEYMEGKPLDQLIKQYAATGLPWDDALEVIKGICSALSHAHAENIIHSDFKPGNIFVTTAGTAKVFDFGIARAVTQVDRRDGKAIDKTVFDAGTLGALTPAYASMEMLQGMEPDVRDDIYALGCIVYEMLTGRHPFNKIPADEACQQGLKPKRITSISKRQWRAIEKSLAFKRADRLGTADEFYQLFTGKFKAGYLVAASLAFVAILSMSIYIVNSGQDGISETDLRNEMEFKIRFDLYQEEIKRLLEKPDFTIDWEENLWREVSGVTEMLPEDDAWLAATRRDIFIRYIEKIRETRADSQLARTKILLENAGRYTDDKNVLNEERAKLAQAIAAEEKRKRAYAENARKEKRRKLAEQKEASKTRDEFNLGLDNVNKQLQCQSQLSMRNFDIAIKQLRTLDYGRYQKMEGKIINSLAACITLIGERFPARATEAKKYALRLFNKHPQIAAIKIKPKDACDQSIAGMGKYGKRGVCRDKIRGLGDGPELVVVPGGKSINAFAIGKYEVSVAELNRFCKKTAKCPILTQVPDSYPATNIPLSTVKQYLRWLSRKSHRKYRLPTKREWLYASNSTNGRHDPNRNCQLSSRGIQKGGELVNTTTGRQNAWGLVNYLGNAQEWVYDKGGKLVVVGGSFRDSMEKCTVTAWSEHSGKADRLTGFRLLRELKEN